MLIEAGLFCNQYCDRSELLAIINWPTFIKNSGQYRKRYVQRKLANGCT